MKNKVKFVFDPIKSEENFETAIFWDSPEVIKKLREEVKKHGRKK